jgi:hypothetical protein
MRLRVGLILMSAYQVLDSISLILLVEEDALR